MQTMFTLRKSESKLNRLTPVTRYTRVTTPVARASAMPLPTPIHPKPPVPTLRSAQAHTLQREKIIEYYRVTVDDYADWSHGFNMHFGLCGLRDNPFDREAMVERMNQRVLATVGLAPHGRYVDLGCGTGATARALARCEPTAQVTAVTISPEQIKRGAALNARHNAGYAAPGGYGQIKFHWADYIATGLPHAEFDGAYALESACHAPGAGKAPLIAEAARLLKPGARLVIADAMLRRDPPTGSLGAAYHTWCRNWAIPQLTELPALLAALKANGFEHVRVEEVSFNVAACAAHIPWVATRFTLTQLWQHRGQLPAWRWRHIGASWLALVLGCAIHKFGYFIVTARRSRT
jgi:MPBQ/MSBQ methyltransferase